jgi:hypothetical protein
VRSHSTVVALVPRAYDHLWLITACRTRGELAPTWPGTPGGEEFPYSVKRPAEDLCAIGSQSGSQTPSTCVRLSVLTRTLCAAVQLRPDHLSDDVGDQLVRWRH